MVNSSSAWSDTQKAALVQQIVSGGLSLERACEEYGVSVEEIKDWVGVFRRSMRAALDRQLRSTLSLQGLEVEELARPEFSGELGALDVADLVQTIQLGRKDARITISHAGGHGYIWCSAGEIVDAEFGQLTAEAALFRLLSLEQGSVVADFGAFDRARRISTPTPQLLLEAATQRDRRVRALQRVGDPARVYAVASNVAARHARDLGPEELLVLSLFDGARSLQQVVTATELPEHEVLEIAAQFLDARMLFPAAAAPVPDSRAPSSVGTGSMAMSYRPSGGSPKPKRARPPLWVLASGAVVCSSLGAVTAIAYADALQRKLGDESAARELSLSAGSSASVSSLAGSSTGLSNTGLSNAALSNAASARALCPAGMALIRGGRFFMGSDSTHPALQYARPAHLVDVDSFCIGTREVTVQEYAQCVASGACEAAHQESDLGEGEHTVSSASRLHHDEQCNAGKPGRENDPINCVSHRQAASYCAFRQGRLASEAEWEFAARGADNRAYPWGNSPPTADHLNACGKECAHWHAEVGLSAELHGLMYEEDDGYAGTAPVGSYPLGATSDGVMDLIGNVFEWTADGLYAYDHQPRANPRGPADSGSFVIRGGNFNSGTPEFSNPSLRFPMAADSYSHGVGLRCAADPERSAGGLGR
ncbi:MAG TPA: SUMF1/EgtB/PvdO family nonheme iron enzyme [Polyangiaceae bacterium]|nr:SUMF1/EgtB/PvdO family nonheme iron enzyme [Polyangiaceae bacterium]